MATDVLFIHGFGGKRDTTWRQAGADMGFPELLESDPDLPSEKLRIDTWGYPTRLDVRYAMLKYFWEDDPSITRIGQGLRSELQHLPGDSEKFVLIGHSMGGLVIQAFILEELANDRRDVVERITEIVLLGTPSAGLRTARMARFFKNQVADMAALGPFILKLRAGWRQFIDDQRDAESRPVSFRLTVCAGLTDSFVPRASALDPFPFDEQELVPGNHVDMVKPTSRDDLVYKVVKKRLTRGTPTGPERRLILGQTKDAIAHVQRIRAAEELESVDDLVEIHRALANRPDAIPRAQRAVGLALLGHERYEEAVEALSSYLDFEMPDGGERPFSDDAQATQQLAIALAGADEPLEAVERLKRLDPTVQEDPETQGVLAGRLKRLWWEEGKEPAGWKALAIYRKAFDGAKEGEVREQVVYNGVNAGFMDFALGGDDYREIARDVLEHCEPPTRQDFWTAAGRAEAHLLLAEYEEALKAYRGLRRHAPPPRWWSITGRQALDILDRQGKPAKGAAIGELFEGSIGSA